MKVGAEPENTESKRQDLNRGRIGFDISYMVTVVAQTAATPKVTLDICGTVITCIKIDWYPVPLDLDRARTSHMKPTKQNETSKSNEHHTPRPPSSSATAATKHELSFGKSTVQMILQPNVRATVIRKNSTVVPNSPSDLLEAALDHPVGGDKCTIESVAKGQQTACILICDITRPVPNHLFLRPVIDRLMKAGMQLEKITILVATGLHRPNLGPELEELIGDPWIMQNVIIHNNYARNDSDFVNLGTTLKTKVPVLVNKIFVEADVKIATGLVEPHFMAGFSGGRKVISPGVCHHSTIRTFHSSRFMGNEHATACNLRSNPLHEAQLEIVQMLESRSSIDSDHSSTRPILAINTVLDEHRNLVYCTFGAIIQSHLEAVRQVRLSAQVFVHQRFDVVVTSSGGYPLDKTFYQTVKGMVTPLDVLKPGGTLIICSECSEGMGSAEFVAAQKEMIAVGPDMFLKSLTNKSLADIDEWQTEELMKSISVGKVVLFSPQLDLQAPTGVERCFNLDDAVRDALESCGEGGEIAIIPEGPYVVPFFSTKILKLK